MNLKSIVTVLAGVLVTGAAFAQDGGAHAAGGPDLAGLGAGIGLGLAALGGGIGQGLSSAAALQGISRNPAASGKIFTPMIIGLAMIESLVIYALIIAFTKMK